MDKYSGIKVRLSEIPWIDIREDQPEDSSWNIFTDGKRISIERYKRDALDHFWPSGRWFNLEDVIGWIPLPLPVDKWMEHADEFNKEKKRKNNLTELSFDEIFIILEIINKCNENSQTECYETINIIKNLYGGIDNE